MPLFDSLRSRKSRIAKFTAIMMMVTPPPAQATIYSGITATILGGIYLTLRHKTDYRPEWSDFRENSAIYIATLMPNHIGLSYKLASLLNTDVSLLCNPVPQDNNEDTPREMHACHANREGKKGKQERRLTV